MKTDIALPYPVLTRDRDDVLPQLTTDSVEAFNKSDVDAYKFEMNLYLQDQTILEHIEQGYAVYVCEVDCPRAFYRRNYQSQSPNFKFDVPRDAVVDEIVVNSYVTVLKPFEYSNPNFNEDYPPNAKFEMSPGDVLAIFPSWVYKAEYDIRASRSAGTYLIARLDESVPHPYFKTDEEKIAICLPKNMYEQFNSSLNRNNREEMQSSLAFSALYCALTERRENWADSAEDKDWTWYVRTAMKNDPQLKPYLNGFDQSQVLEIVRIILKNPFERLFDKLSQPADTLF